MGLCSNVEYYGKQHSQILVRPKKEGGTRTYASRAKRSGVASRAKHVRSAYAAQCPTKIYIDGVRTSAKQSWQLGWLNHMPETNIVSPYSSRCVSLTDALAKSRRVRDPTMFNEHPLPL